MSDGSRKSRRAATSGDVPRSAQEFVNRIAAGKYDGGLSAAVVKEHAKALASK